MRDEHPSIHPAVSLALCMMACVALGVGLLLWPMFQQSRELRDGKTAAPSNVRGSAITDLHWAGPAPIESAEPRIEQGVKLSFEDANGSHDARRARLVALYVPEGEPPTPFLSPGPFTATWAGELNIELRDRFIFTFEGNGTFELKINDQSVLSSGERQSQGIRLRKGPNQFVARYRSPASGPAQMRLLWKGSDFPQEPIPPTILTHDATDVQLRGGEQLRQGRELLATGRCFRCHLADGPLSPDLLRDAPILIHTGTRLTPNWVADWLQDPRSMRVDAQMPDLLHGPSSKVDAQDIAAYLNTLQNRAVHIARVVNPYDAQLVERGRQVYMALGCVGCHSLGATQPNDHSDDRIPLNDVARKYQNHTEGLLAYLAEPSRYYAWTAMPDFFGPVDQDVRALAAYLSNPGAVAIEQVAAAAASGAPVELIGPKGNADRGRQLVESLGCANCHAGLPVGSSLKSPRFAQVSRSSGLRGCMAADEASRGLAPDFGFSDEQRTALAAAMRAEPESVGRFIATEFAQRQVEVLRCTACHRHDGRTDDWTRLAGPAANLEAPKPADNKKRGAEIDQTRPMLTFAGEKLRTHYLERIIGGQLKEKPRPWMDARMPSFGIHSRWLAQGLAMMHGFPPADDAAQPPDPTLAQIGQKLADKRWGFGCTDCHGIGGQPALNPFEAVGIPFDDIPDRLRHGWYLRWMLDPTRIEPATKMPRYADLNGDTQLTDILDGSGVEQFEAIWHYLRLEMNKSK